MPGGDAVSSATDYNRETYDRLWGQLSDFIRYNPGARHRRRHVFALLQGHSFQSLLDVGCGNGELLRLVDAQWPGRRLAGVDLSSAVVAQNSAALPAMSFSVANAETDPLPTGFDVVLCSEVIEHVSAPQQLLRKLFASVVEGGHVILTCPTGTVWPTERHFGHVRHPTPADVTVWARDAGFVVEELWSWGFPTYALTKWAQNLKPEQTLRHFAGDRPYGVAQIAVSTAVWLANFVNVRSSPWGVQLFVRLRRPAADVGGSAAR